MSVTKANILSAFRDFKTLQDAYNEEKFLTEQYQLPTATRSRLGGVKVGVGLSIDSNGILSSTGTGGGTGYTLPAATKNQLGGVKVGTGLETTADGTLNVTLEPGNNYTLPTASPTTKGGAKIGTGLKMNGDTLSVAFGDYTLPVASETQLGGIKVGTGLSMADDTLNVTLETGEEYSVFEGATSIRGGDVGLVPAPSAGDNTRFLRGDGTRAAANMTVINQGGSTTIIEDKPAIQGALWQDYISGIGGMSSSLCLKLRYNDYEYNFHYDEVDHVGTTTTPLDTTPGMVYKLGTAESTVDGGLWYSLNDAGTPLLKVHRGVFNYGYHYDSITYKGNNDNLWAYLPFESSTDDACNNMTVTSSGTVSDHPLGGKAYFTNTGALTLQGALTSPWTIDFWVCFATTTTAKQNPTGRFLDIKRDSTNDVTIVFCTQSGFTFFNESVPAVPFSAGQRYHIAISYKQPRFYGFFDGVLRHTYSKSATIKTVHFLKDKAPAYIDHLRVTNNQALWTENFTPPVYEDYFK